MSVTKRQLYMDIATEANEPILQRKTVANGRGGIKKVARRYHLKADEIIALKKEMEELQRFVSPYGVNRIYTCIINAIVSLGENKPHSMLDAYNKFIELGSSEETKDLDGRTLWERFSEKEVRNTETGRDPLGKFVQNIEVLQRLGGDHPYAFKLAQVGACIDILVGADQQVMVMLRTGIADGDPVKPVNMNRKRAYTKTLDSIPSGTIISE